MSDKLPNIGWQLPLVPPPGCPAVLGNGVEDLRTSHFSVSVLESDWEPAANGSLTGSATEVEIGVIFSRGSGNIEDTVESGGLVVPVDDPLADIAEAIEAHPPSREAVRRKLCELILRCPGPSFSNRDGARCGVLTESTVERLLREAAAENPDLLKG